MRIKPFGVLGVHLVYDALARRTRKVVLGTEAEGQVAPKREVRFMWDGHVPLHEVASEGLTTWLFEPESFSPLAREDATKRYAVVTDHLGAPTEMYDELGQLAWRMQLDAFGVGKADVALQHCPWRWPGQYEDVETGLHYNRYRYYDPQAGRYISQDPLGLSGGLSLYGYVPDPLSWMDPLGLSQCKASELKKIEPGTSQWAKAVEELRAGGGKGINFRVQNQKIARQLLEEARPGIPKRRSYAGPKNSQNHGFEYHLKDETAGAPANDLRHLKWYDWRANSTSQGNGHIFFDEWI